MAARGAAMSDARAIPRLGPPALEVKGLGVYYGHSHALQGVDLTLETGVFSVVGRNGMGKTTLCKAIMGLVPVSTGSVRVRGEDITGWSPTRFIEFRREGHLLALAVTDFCATGLSAVYTFFEPGEEARGLGTFAILSQLRLAHEHALPHLYLGFWIAGHPKMHYKSRFRPLEVLRGEKAPTERFDPRRHGVTPIGRPKRLREAS